MTAAPNDIKMHIQLYLYSLCINNIKRT